MFLILTQFENKDSIAVNFDHVVAVYPAHPIGTDIRLHGVGEEVIRVREEFTPIQNLYNKVLKEGL